MPHILPAMLLGFGVGIVAGFYAWKYLKEELTYFQTMARLEELLALEYRPWETAGAQLQGD